MMTRLINFTEEALDNVYLNYDWLELVKDKKTHVFKSEVLQMLENVANTIVTIKSNHEESMEFLIEKYPFKFLGLFSTKKYKRTVQEVEQQLDERLSKTQNLVESKITLFHIKEQTIINNLKNLGVDISKYNTKTTFTS